MSENLSKVDHTQNIFVEITFLFGEQKCFPTHYIFRTFMCDCCLTFSQFTLAANVLRFAHLWQNMRVLKTMSSGLHLLVCLNV